MAIDDLVKNAAQRISDAVTSAKSDIGALRSNILDHADRCLAVVRDGGVDHPWLTSADADTIAFSPTTSEARPLLINGKSTTFWAKPDIEAAIDRFLHAVRQGEFDDQFASEGQPVVSPKIEGEQVPVDADNGSLTTGGGRSDADEKATRFTEHVGTWTVPGLHS